MGTSSPCPLTMISGRLSHNMMLISLRLLRKGFYLFAQAVLPLLLDSVESSQYPPSLIITGATASLRGSAAMSSFASGKFALRATGQSLAREFGM